MFNASEKEIIVQSDTFKVGDIVSWNSEAGYVSGRISNVHIAPFMVNGYQHHATPTTPQYEIVSLKTGHVAFHKGSALTHID